ncbi:MAG: NUDIX domain-containing protein [Nanoarchaeota archaeon]|nr:NUDIX domain-containing protein [Nanoarchaeota archaeon]MBU1031019.1 NUDIX domain-containing protein [Nanoarchaeota archaeon]MBU1849466.1 NUDIX domain-containing protein [Nanoarchaeota archaeon]
MEYFDVVNENDEVIGKASRDEVHQKKLIHRAVTIFVFNSKNQLFMIQRSRNKKLNPLKWQGSASGYVESGESYELSAKRELKEELNINAEPKFEFDVKTFSDEQKEFFKLFSVKTNDPITVNDEIEQSKFMSIDDIKVMIENNSSQFRDAFLMMFNRYFS